jgi:histidinol dehydrogenase
VNIEIDRQLKTLKRKTIIEGSLNGSGAIYVGSSIADCIDLLNECAPEHAELMVEDPIAYSHLVTDAGAVFLGEYSPEPLGDYYAGPNHTLPTGGTAKFFSPLGVYDFMKKTSIISYSKEELEKVHGKIEMFARCEQLDAHANAISVRFREDKNEQTV